MSDGRASTSLEPGEPAAVALQERVNDGTMDDEQEWEYEYSSTETETYYLTVELSYPEFKTLSKPQGLHKTRGGHYKTWLGHANEPGDPLEPSTARKAGAGTRRNQAGVLDEEDDDEPVPAAEAEDDDNMDIDPSLMNQTYEMDADRREQEKQKAAAEKERQKRKRPSGGDKDADEAVLQPIQDIQILDLHSERPFISYRGRVFEGEWAEVVGTELILADHNDKNRGLPALRTMPGDVDLLAASCSRILTTEKALKPKNPEEDPLADVRKEWLISIPPGVDKSGERAQQASFLEKLIALKLKKGEKDQVTVYAKEAIGKNFKDHRDPTSRRRMRIPGPNDELDDDGHPIGKKRRIRQTDHRTRASVGLPSQGLPSGGRLSVPVPNRWADTRVSDEDEGGDGEDAEADENEDIDVSSDDINSPDEDGNNDEGEEDDEDDEDRDNSNDNLDSDSSQQNDDNDDNEDDDEEYSEYG